MKHKTSELTGPMLESAIRLIEGLDGYGGGAIPSVYSHCEDGSFVYSPPQGWALVGYLIDKYEIALTPETGGEHWTAWATNPDDEADTRHMGEGETPQIAICRAVVRSVFGAEVELPE